MFSDLIREKAMDRFDSATVGGRDRHTSSLSGLFGMVLNRRPHRPHDSCPWRLLAMRLEWRIEPAGLEIGGDSLQVRAYRTAIRVV